MAYTIRDTFRFNLIWHGGNVAAHFLCWRLAERDVTVMPSVTCMDWLRWWYNRTTDTVSPSTALAFGMEISEKCNSTSPSAVQVKTQHKTVNIEVQLDVISWLEKDEQIVDICHNVRLAHGNVYTVHYNAERIPENAKSGNKVLV
jgi:hypothetical protein